jgi:class 3 adenylate cyclase
MHSPLNCSSPRRTDDTTVMFIYIDGYSELLASHGTDKTIEWLDSVFCMYDRMISRRFAGKVVKIETLSNFYLAASGCPIPTKDHAMECILAVIYLLKATRLVRRPDGGPTTVRAGLCSGPTCAGVIGNACPRFSIFGDTVNTASRMASTADSSDYNLECSVHLAESTMGLVGFSLNLDPLTLKYLKLRSRLVSRIFQMLCTLLDSSRAVFKPCTLSCLSTLLHPGPGSCFSHLWATVKE